MICPLNHRYFSFLFITYNYSIYAYSRWHIESIRALSTILYHKKSQILGLLNDVVSSVYASEQVGNDHLSEWTVYAQNPQRARFKCKVSECRANTSWSLMWYKLIRYIVMRLGTGLVVLCELFDVHQSCNAATVLSCQISGKVSLSQTAGNELSCTLGWPNSWSIHACGVAYGLRYIHTY